MKVALRALLLLLTGTLCAACSTVFYDRTKTGRFEGSLRLEWVAPDYFVYHPDPADPLVYIAADKSEVHPGLMYTDGGSVPRPFWSIPQLGPWDFGPGYIVHDWLFHQHHCKDPGWEQVDFDRSAALLAEAVKTQMVNDNREDATVVWAIYEAVRLPVARDLWEHGRCLRPPTKALLTPDGQPVVPVVIRTYRFPH
jgi:hypothetical protein